MLCSLLVFASVSFWLVAAFVLCFLIFGFLRLCSCLFVPVSLLMIPHLIFFMPCSQISVSGFWCGLGFSLLSRSPRMQSPACAGLHCWADANCCGLLLGLHCCGLGDAPTWLHLGSRRHPPVRIWPARGDRLLIAIKSRFVRPCL